MTGKSADRPAGSPGSGTARLGRIVIGTLGLDQHEVGAMAISHILVRNGYEVIYAGRFNTPDRLAAIAEQEDADVIGISVHSWEWTAYADELLSRCADLGIGLVFGGSVLTDGDQSTLLARGADAVFGPYAPEAAMLEEIAAVVRRIRAGERTAHSQADRSPEQPRSLPLTGRVVIVTGAAHGLGRSYTLEICRQGGAVIGNDVDEAALAELTQVAKGTPGSLHVVAADITDTGAPAALLRTALNRYGQLHGLVSNAGLLRSGPILQLADDDLRLLMDVHVTASFRLMRALGGYWRSEHKAGRGVAASVVLTTSSAGLYGFRAEAAYSAAKAAVAMLARVAADELGRYGVTVNAIAPAARTRLTAWLGESSAAAADDPLAAEHVAPVVAWLLGPSARTITGRVLEAGNGQISEPTGWRAGQPVTLPPLMDPAAADALLRQVLALAPQTAEILTAQVGYAPSGL